MIFLRIVLLAVRATSFAPSSPLAVRNFPDRDHHAHAKVLFTAAAEAVETNDPSTIDNTNEPPASPASDATLPILFPALATSLAKLGFSTPTPIQSASAKRALSSQNLLLIAPTGSGKTFSYMLPALERVLVNRNNEIIEGGGSTQGRRSTVLVVAPTRELGLQLMRDTTSILSNLKNNDDDDDSKLSVLLAIQGVEMPTARDLNAATVLIGTARELLDVLSDANGGGGSDFLAGNVLSSIVLDEIDVLLPNSPKVAGGGGNADGKGKKKGGGKTTPREERRRLVQKRKLLAAKRGGAEFSSDRKIVGPTETLLRMIAGRRSYLANNNVREGTATYPYQILAGSATASRKTLDRLNKALRDAAVDVSSTVDVVWNGPVQPCRPAEGLFMERYSNGDNTNNDDDHTIRSVTVPSQVEHRYVRLEKDRAAKPGAVLTAVAQAARVLKPKRALLFLCGEFKKQTTAAGNGGAQPDNNIPKTTVSAQMPSRERRGRQKTLMQKKAEATAASRAKQPARGLSAGMACFGLGKLGIEARPLHVALGLDETTNNGEDGAKADGDVANDEKANNDGDEGGGLTLPPFLVTFEGAARGLHLDDVDAVFIVGRPSSAASYLHLAGRVGRSSTSESGDVIIRPGNVVSFCTAGSSKELNKWTRQVGGTDLEELVIK